MKIVFGFVFALCTSSLLAQVDTSKVIKVSLADTLQKDPLIWVYHSMGDVNVQGHQNNDVLVYAQQLLPSAELFFNDEEREELFSFENRQTGAIRELNRSRNFLITKEDHVVEIRTNMFSFNTNVFVMVPQPSSVSVNILHQGSIDVQGIEGDLEANTDFGSINFADVEGSIVANTGTGEVVADFSNTGVNKPIYLSSFVGNIEIIVPKETQSNLALYSELGQLYSNFNKENELMATPASTNPRERKRFPFRLKGGGTDLVAKTIKGDIYLRHVDE